MVSMPPPHTSTFLPISKPEQLRVTGWPRLTQVRIVCVPAFGVSGEAVLLDLETLDCTPIRFGSALGSSSDVVAAAAGGGNGRGSGSAFGVKIECMEED